MLKSMLRGALVALIAAATSAGCADETTAVDLPHVEPVQLTFHASDPQRVLINEAILLAELGRTMSSATKWPIRTARETTDAVLETGSRTQHQGQQHVLLIQYVALSRYLSGGYTGTTLSIPIEYTISRTEDTVKVALTFPEHGNVERRGMPLLTRKLWDMHQILDDYVSLAGKLPTSELHFNYQARGELESKYRPEAVLGNLERMLSRPVRGSVATTQVSGGGAVTRDENFVCTIGGERREVQISTFPYHDATKVSYVSTLPYTLRADGTMTGGDDVAALNALLAKVIND